MLMKNFFKKKLICNIGGIASAVCFSISAVLIDTSIGRVMFFIAFLLFQLWLFLSKTI